jgi:hypothetical protein
MPVTSKKLDSYPFSLRYSVDARGVAISVPTAHGFHDLELRQAHPQLIKHGHIAVTNSESSIFYPVSEITSAIKKENTTFWRNLVRFWWLSIASASSQATSL